MEIDKRELKILSLDFRRIANRLLHCNHETGMDLLIKLLAFIDNNEIISDFVQGYIDPNETLELKGGEVFKSMGKTKQEEISFTYRYLKYCSENYHSYYYNMAMRYGREADAAINEFNNRIVLPFINYIEGYLVEIGIKMGYDENVKYTININGGTSQVNVADGNANVTAQQSGD